MGGGGQMTILLLYGCASASATPVIRDFCVYVRVRVEFGQEASSGDSLLRKDIKCSKNRGRTDGRAAYLKASSGFLIIYIHIFKGG